MGQRIQYYSSILRSSFRQKGIGHSSAPKYFDVVDSVLFFINGSYFLGAEDPENPLSCWFLPDVKPTGLWAVLSVICSPELRRLDLGGQLRLLLGIYIRLYCGYFGWRFNRIFWNEFWNEFRKIGMRVLSKRFHSSTAMPGQS